MNLEEEIEQSFEYTERSPLWLSGFLVLGVLIGLLGSLVVAWHYHIDVEPQIIGLHFLALSVGYVLAATVGADLGSLDAFAHAGAAFLRIGGHQFGRAWRTRAAGFAALSHHSAAAFIGISAGGLIYRSALRLGTLFRRRAGRRRQRGWLAARLRLSAFHHSHRRHLFPRFRRNLWRCWWSAATGNGRAGDCCRASSFCLFLVNRFSLARRPVGEREEDLHREMLRDLRSIATVLFSLLLFFQFGNEWAIAGWLPLFLIHRFGLNPAWAIGILGFYFFALIFGRLVAQALLEWFNHRKLLLGSIVLAMIGYVVLSFANSAVGALIAVAIIGAGYAPIYPLDCRALDDRFSYHPGFWNGTVSIAITGAMCAPWILGYVDQFFGVEYVMVVPALGSVAVCILSILLMYEAHLMGEKKRVDGTDPLISADDV